MIIDDLIAYAARNSLGEVAVGPKAARWVLDCAAANNIEPSFDDFSIMKLGQTTEKKNRGLEFPVCPETPGMNSGGKSHLLVETIDVVLGVHEWMKKPASELTDKEMKKLAGLPAKHAFFVRSLEQMAEVMPEAVRFVPFLNDEEFCWKIFDELMAKKAKSSEKITLRAISTATNQSIFLVNDERWRPWWPGFLAALSGATPTENETDSADSGTSAPPKRTPRGVSKGPEQVISLATGDLVAPASTHPQITELGDVGASSMGASFIGFDKDALQSYGFDKSANAAMSNESAAAYRAAMNTIFRDHSRRYGNVKIGCWFDSFVDPAENPIEWLESPENSQDVRESYSAAADLLEAWETGKKKKPTGVLFHMLILSGNAGRIIIRDWSTSELVKLVEAVDHWFRDFEIVRRDGAGTITGHKFYAIICSLLRDPSGEMKTISALIVALWKAALNPLLPIPEAAVRMAMRRHRADLLADSENPIAPNHARMGLIRAADSRSRRIQKKIAPNHARMGLIRAYLVRNRKDSHMKPYLNEDHPDVAYQCGRLMAILENLQYIALDGVNASVIQRFYNAAATTPNLVFARLMRMGNVYIQKMKSGLADIYKKRIEDIYTHISQDIPKTFSLEQQARFDMGYFHQSAQNRKEREENKAAKEEREKTAASDSVSDTNG